jgi:hypothetical protein
VNLFSVFHPDFTIENLCYTMRDLTSLLKVRRDFVKRSILKRNILVSFLHSKLPPLSTITFKPRMVNVRKEETYSESAWGRMLRNPNIKDPTTVAGKLFRRRFRVPYPLFEDILGTNGLIHKFSLHCNRVAFDFCKMNAKLTPKLTFWTFNLYDIF